MFRSRHTPVAKAHSAPANAHATPFFQPKLTVNTPGDAYEQEADRVADQVMRMQNGDAPVVQRMPITPLSVQRKCAHCEKEEKAMRKETGGGVSGQAAPTAVSDVLSSGGGQPMDAGTRQWAESRFGQDFSQVRVHTDARAADSAAAIQARAYTSGSNVVFGAGEYQPQRESGQRLLAHELVHVGQQTGQVQRTDYGGIANAPANWSTQVAAATTPAAKAALIQTAVGTTVTVSDRTAQSAGDASPDPAHLLPYTAASPTVNFDDGLITKTSRVTRGTGRPLTRNAGYTFTSRGMSYVVLSNLAIDANNYYETVFTLNHELDHVRQNIAGSTLTGNASELDAWTSTFIREFHRMYSITDSGTNCFIGYTHYPTFSSLIGYYELAGATERQAACARMVAYFNSVIQPHAGHLKVFQFWIRRSLDRSPHTLADDLNTQLNLGINTTQTVRSYQTFPCTGITSLTFPAAPTPDLPTFPAATGAGAAPSRP